MPLPPILPRAQVDKRSHRRRMLDILCGDPDMDNKKLALLVGATEQFIRAMRRSDTFRHDLAKMVRERYGDQLDGVRADILTAHAAAVKRLTADLNSPELTPAEVVDAAKLVMEHSTKLNFQDVKDSPDRPQHETNITINFEDLNRARNLALQHSKELVVIPDEMEKGTDAPLPVVREEGDAV